MAPPQEKSLIKVASQSLAVIAIPAHLLGPRQRGGVSGLLPDLGGVFAYDDVRLTRLMRVLDHMEAGHPCTRRPAEAGRQHGSTRMSVSPGLPGMGTLVSAHPWSRTRHASRHPARRNIFYF